LLDGVGHVNDLGHGSSIARRARSRTFSIGRQEVNVGTSRDVLS
jgi:hypothetical protein